MCGATIAPLSPSPPLMTYAIEQKPKRSGAIFSSALLMVLWLLAVAACKDDETGKPQAASAFVYHEGDIVFQSLPHNALVDAIEGATKSEWSHCGVVMRERDGWFVYEALGTVHRTPLSTWIQRGRGGGRYAVYRLKPDTVFDVEKLRDHLGVFLGKEYDLHYAPDDSEIYCSELVHKAYDRAAGIKIGAWQTLGSLDWKPFEGFILTIESSVPLERSMVTPVALTRSELVERVHAGNAKEFKAASARTAPAG